MKRTSICTATSVLSLLLMTSQGCVDDQSDASVFIMYNAVPQEGCVVPAQEGSGHVVGGLIEVESPYGYIFTPLLKNFARTTETVGMERRIAFVEGADVRLDLYGGFSAEQRNALEGSSVTNFSAPFSASVSPNGGTAGVGFEIVPVFLLRELRDQLDPFYGRAQIRATIRVYGTMGGGSFTSQDYTYWVDVCDGCIAVNHGTCGTTASPSYKGGACNPMQDRPVDCCTQGGTLLCPAPDTPPVEEPY